MKMVLNKEIILQKRGSLGLICCSYMLHQVPYHILPLSNLHFSFCLEFPFASNRQTLIAMLIGPLCNNSGNWVGDLCVQAWVHMLSALTVLLLASIN